MRRPTTSPVAGTEPGKRTRSSRLSAPERREQILDVAAELVVKNGFPAVSVEAVARAAAISRPIVYEHFGDLAGLFDALIGRETGRALTQARQNTLPEHLGQDPAKMMVSTLGDFLQAVEEHPTTWRLVLTPPEGAPEKLHETFQEGRDTIARTLNEAVAPLLLAGDGPFDPDVTARILSTLADEYARLLLTHPETFTRERLLRHASLIVKHLVAVDASTPPEGRSPSSTGRSEEAARTPPPL